MLEDDKDTGELTKQMRANIDDYVDKTFKSRVPSKDVSTPYMLSMLSLFSGLHCVG